MDLQIENNLKRFTTAVDNDFLDLFFVESFDHTQMINFKLFNLLIHHIYAQCFAGGQKWRLIGNYFEKQFENLASEVFLSGSLADRGSLHDILHIGSDMDIMFIMTPKQLVDVNIVSKSDANCLTFQQSKESAIYYLLKSTESKGYLSVSSFKTAVHNDENLLSKYQAINSIQFHVASTDSPALKFNMQQGRANQDIDLVYCLEMPSDIVKSMKAWSTRKSRINWPDESLMKRCMDLKLLLVPTGPRLKPCKNLWRLSFSLMEKELFRSFLNVHLIVFSIGKILIKGNCSLPTYFIKTSFLWLVEETPKCAWKFANMSKLVKVFIDRLLHSLTKRNLPHYFEPSHNLLDLSNGPLMLSNIKSLAACQRNIFSKLVSAVDAKKLNNPAKFLVQKLNADKHIPKQMEHARKRYIDLCNATLVTKFKKLCASFTQTKLNESVNLFLHLREPFEMSYERFIISNKYNPPISALTHALVNATLNDEIIRQNDVSDKLVSTMHFLLKGMMNIMGSECGDNLWLNHSEQLPISVDYTISMNHVLLLMESQGEMQLIGEKLGNANISHKSLYDLFETTLYLLKVLQPLVAYQFKGEEKCLQQSRLFMLVMFANYLSGISTKMDQVKDLLAELGSLPYTTPTIEFQIWHRELFKKYPEITEQFSVSNTENPPHTVNINTNCIIKTLLNASKHA